MISYKILYDFVRTLSDKIPSSHVESNMILYLKFCIRKLDRVQQECFIRQARFICLELLCLRTNQGKFMSRLQITIFS